MAARLRRGLSMALAAVVNWRYFTPTVFLVCLIPGVLLARRLWLVLTGADPSALGADPTKLMEHETGRYALMILLASLTVTPLRRLFHLNRIQRVRRMLGLWAFAYAVAHVALYLTLDQLCYSPATCQWPTIWEDVTRRPFIVIGAVSFILLAVLALTSTMGWMRRLGRNWQRLHRVVYAAAAAGAVHFAWGQKADISEPLWWGSYLGLLLLLRLVLAVRKRQARLVPAVSR